MVLRRSWGDWLKCSGPSLLSPAAPPAEALSTSRGIGSGLACHGGSLALLGDREQMTSAPASLCQAESVCYYYYFHNGIRTAGPGNVYTKSGPDRV